MYREKENWFDLFYYSRVPSYNNYNYQLVSLQLESVDR